MFLSTFSKITNFLLLNSAQSYMHDISISMCGWDPEPTDDNFIRHVVAFSDLCNNPSLFESESLVVRIKKKYYTWKVAAPIISSLIIYQRPLPQVSFFFCFLNKIYLIL